MLSGSLPQNGLQTCHGEDFSEAVAAVTGGREGEEGRRGGEGGREGEEGRWGARGGREGEEGRWGGEGGGEGEEGRWGGEGGRGEEVRGHPVVAVGVKCSDPDFVEVCQC